jgi:hypothetical protein
MHKELLRSMEKKTWTLPVETVFNGDTMEDDYVLTFPEDLLEQAGWKAGDVLNWIDNCHDDFDPDEDMSIDEYLKMLQDLSFEELIEETGTDDIFTLDQFMEAYG